MTIWWPVQAALCSARIIHCDRSQGITLSRLAASLAGFQGERGMFVLCTRQ